MRRLAMLFICGAVVAPAPVARADPPATADSLFVSGQAHYQAGEFQAAIALFQQAYELAHDPVYLFNIAQSYRKIADCEEAFAYYKRYVTEAPKAPNRAKVEGWLRELQPCVDQREREHVAATRAVELERQRREDDERRRARAASPHEDLIDRGASLRIAGIAIGAVGFAAIGGGIAYALHGSTVKQQLAAACARGCVWDSPPILKLDDEGRSANTLAKVGLVGGGVAAAAGIALFVMGRARIEHVLVTPGEGGATVSAQLRW